MSSHPSVLVAVIGNMERGDDGVGPAVAARLGDKVPAWARLLAVGGDVLALIEEWAGLSHVIVVDAAAPIDQPGRIHRLDLTSQPVPVEAGRASTHALGLAAAVELGRSLGRLPRRLVAYLVEGACFAVGAPLSPAVAAAADAVAECILDELARLSVLQGEEGPAGA